MLLINLKLKGYSSIRKNLTIKNPFYYNLGFLMRQEIVPYEKKISLCVGFLGGPQGHSFYNV